MTQHVSETSPVTMATANYYAEMLSVSPEAAQMICSPLILFDETSNPLGMRVQEIRQQELGQSALLKRATLYTHLFADRIDQSYDSAQAVNEYKASKDSLSHATLSKDILHKNVVTGRIASLAIAAVSPQELPGTIVPRKRIFKGETAVWDESKAAYFVMGGKVVIGGRLGTIACGIRMDTCEEGRIERPNDEYAYHHRLFALTSKGFPKSALGSLQLWQDSTTTALSLEAARRATPFGGLLS